MFLIHKAGELTESKLPEDSAAIYMSKLFRTGAVFATYLHCFITIPAIRQSGISSEMVKHFEMISLRVNSLIHTRL